MDENKWDKRYLDLAQLVSTWSKDNSTKVGAVIVSPANRVISLGFNGLPPYVPDDPNILENREEKYKWIIHAEQNALLTAKQDLTGSTIYTYPFGPCSQCSSAIIQAGIMRVVFPKCEEPRWKDKIEESKKFLLLADLMVTEYSDLGV